MNTPQDNSRRRKAFLYTAAICLFFLIAFVFISWKVLPPAPAMVLQQIDINLGNDTEGFGDVQPLLKGELTPEPTEAAPDNSALVPPTQSNESVITPDDNAPADAAPVERPIIKPNPRPLVPVLAKPTPKPVANIPAATVVAPTPKPRTPKVVMTGAGKGGGNNATEDNGYTMQGKNVNGKGDVGSPTGSRDSYGDKPGGSKVSAPRVISGNRKVLRAYSFNGELDKATINAIIKVSPDGVGTFLRIGQGSTSTNGAYANAIRGYLQAMKFDTAADESTVTVQFNFTIQ